MLFEKVSQFWSLWSETLELPPSPCGDSKSVYLMLAVPRASLRSILLDANCFGLGSDTQNFRLSWVNMRDNFLPFSVIQGTLPPSLHIIGSARDLTFTRIFRRVLLTSACYFCIFHFSRIFLPANLRRRTSHNGISTTL